MRVYRQGRTRQYSVEQTANRDFCRILCLKFFLGIFVLAAPIYMYATELSRKQMLVAFSEAGDNIQSIPARGSHAQPGAVLHMSSDIYEHDVPVPISDKDFAVTVTGAMNLKRSTEYCQWQEYEHCRRDCDRECDQDGQNCRDVNCVETCKYTYEKGWRSHRINSFVFDQPAAHYNPPRDPFPSSGFTAERVNIGDFSMGQSFISKLRAPFRYVDFTFNGIPTPPGMISRFFTWITGWQPAPEIVKPLNAFNVDNSYAGVEHDFHYVGRGYFYSPYKLSTAELLLKKAGEYMEGSLLDYQLGDFLGYALNACEAGDIRVSYSAQSPNEVSVLSSVNSKKELVPWKTSTGYDLGLFHSGVKDPNQMMDDEVSDMWWKLTFAKVIVLVWSVVICFSLDYYQSQGTLALNWPFYGKFNSGHPHSNWPVFAIPFCLAGGVSALVNIIVWNGVEMKSLMLLSACGGAGYYIDSLVRGLPTAHNAGVRGTRSQAEDGGSEKDK